jgi:hypothetical protein
MVEVIAIISAAVAAFLVLFMINVIRRGNRLLAQPHPKHIAFVDQLSKEELEIAYNETLVGIASAGEWQWSSSKTLAEIEIALSLYVQLMKVRGEPIRYGEKGKLRIESARAANAATAKPPVGGTRFFERLALFQPFKVDQFVDELPDRTNLDDTVNQMKRALE